ncbi:MAG: M20/M25/M40 family metallo-hydrolase, partial [Leptospiraceae bacterium]|nr:M20/M25/M40 family metallo-hydrolase [Leptospiraceae bacterium]
ASTPVKEEIKYRIPETKKISFERFSRGLRIPTISNSNYSSTNFEPFEQYIQLLQKEYPNIFKLFEVVRINKFNLVLHLKGKNSSLKPILFLAHTDVVSPGELSKWKINPFNGDILNGKIHGRGTLDMKNMVHGVLEACDYFIEKDQPLDRGIYIALGHDEEVGGREGAVRIAQYFSSKEINFEAIFDEGGIVTKKGSIKGIDSDIALIGVAEKGFLSAKIKVKGKGGHSSIPPLESAMGNAAKILVDLENNQLPSRLTPTIQDFLKNIGGVMPFPTKIAIANQWLLKPILLKKLSSNPSTNAITRTTTALTMMKGSDGTNIIAPEVEIVVNFRILPGETVEDIRNHIKNATKDYDVEIEEVSNTRGASMVSPSDSPSYRSLEKVVRQLYPEAIITPYITVGGTDAFKYEKLSSNIFRFNPVLLDTEDRATIHNYNESISIENYRRTIEYYKLLIYEFNK